MRYLRRKKKCYYYYELKLLVKKRLTAIDKAIKNSIDLINNL